MNRMRLEPLQKKLQQNNICALLITYPMNRRYITGFTGSSGVALITNYETILFTDSRYVTQSQREAPGWEVVLHHESIMESVAERCRLMRISSLAFESEHLTFHDYTDLQSSLPQVSLIPTVEWVESIRMKKDAEEVNLIRSATSIVDRTFEQIIQEIQPGMTEHELAIRIEFIMREFGASSASFETIVASGERSALPHGLASEKELVKGDFVLLDFGARVQGYTSDITRTVVLGSASEKQKEIYEIVLMAQKKAIEGIASGMTGKQVDAISREWIADHGYDEYFGHATGHGIGLEVHEPPALRSTSDEYLTEGMVVTVEPGIYLPGVGGVRIEDDVLITSSGGEVLTKASKELIEIDC